MTIAELIAELHKFPEDKLVTVEDADTGWIGDKIHINHYQNMVVLSI